MNRRIFLRALLAAPVAAICVPKIVPSVQAWKPHKAQLDFMGVPYHQSNASTGTWMGITRAETPEFRADYKFYSAHRPLLDLESPFYSKLKGK
jgi:hypothetical protein